jgi:hypothetical protein
MGSGVFDIVPNIHASADRKREATWHARLRAAADRLRTFATQSETEPVTFAALVSLLDGLPVPDSVRKPAEWAIYDRYGA